MIGPLRCFLFFSLSNNHFWETGDGGAHQTRSAGAFQLGCQLRSDEAQGLGAQARPYRAQRGGYGQCNHNNHSNHSHIHSHYHHHCHQHIAPRRRCRSQRQRRRGLPHVSARRLHVRQRVQVSAHRGAAALAPSPQQEQHFRWWWHAAAAQQHDAPQALTAQIGRRQAHAAQTLARVSVLFWGYKLSIPLY